MYCLLIGFVKGARLVKGYKDIKRIEIGNSQNGLFSIIVPVLNNARQIQQCIDSFAVQSFKNKELIIIDGGSTDGTLEVICKNRHLIRKSLSCKDSGIYEACNQGVNLSRGEWLLFLGSDDILWDRNVLLNVSQAIDEKRDAQKIVYGQVAVLNKKREVLAVKGDSWNTFKNKPIGKWSFNHQSIFHHRSMFEQYGLYDESFQLLGDHELLLRELKTNDALFLEGLIVAGFALGGTSSQARNCKLMYEERGKIFLIHNILNERVASRKMRCKIHIYESLRFLFGLNAADRMWRFVNYLRKR